MRKPNVFIIVLSWNNYEDTAECLLSLDNLSYENYQIVLVDNGSTDGSAERLQREFPHMHTIINQDNLGFAAGCNVGIKYGLERGADALLLINNDAILERQSLEPAMQTLFSDKEIGIVGGKIKQYYNPSYIDTTGANRIIWPIMATRGVGAGRLDKGQFDKRDERMAVSGALMLIRRDVFDIVGLLPEEYFFSCEDVDFCLNARKKGFRIVYEPSFVAYHKGGASSSRNSPKYVYGYFLHRQVLMKRHLNPLLWRVGRKLLILYANHYWYKRYVNKKESLDVGLQKEIREAIQLAFEKGRFISQVERNYLEE